jgi:hypothetical protein
MATRERATPEARRSDRPRAAARPRLAYLDNLKVWLIAGIIASHAFFSYSEFGSWAYQDVREVSLSSAAETTFVLVASIGALFLMGLFFLMAGLLTPPALERKGIRSFVRDRLFRLGVPFVAFTLVLWPLTIYVVREPFLHRGSYWWWFTHSEPLFDNGPLWFVGVLLLYSLGYAAWRVWGPEREPLRTDGPRPRLLVGLGIAMAVASFIIRIEFPMDSAQVLNLHVWEWPQCLGMFALGVAGARRGWLMPVTDRLRRGCGVVALIAAFALPLLVLTSEPLGLDEEVYFGGFGWPALATAAVEGALTVSACLWVLGFAQQRLNRAGPPVLARSAYAAFLLQGPVLVALALALRPLPGTGELKALVLAVTGVTMCYAVAKPLVTRTPLGRIL